MEKIIHSHSFIVVASGKLLSWHEDSFWSQKPLYMKRSSLTGDYFMLLKLFIGFKAET